MTTNIRFNLRIGLPHIDEKMEQVTREMDKTNYSLRPHQVVGVRWLLQRELTSGLKGGLLCDDPGLGKTIQIGAMMKGNPVGKTLIVVPTAVLHQWRDAMVHIFGEDKVYMHVGGNRVKNVYQWYYGDSRLSFGSVVITSYGMVFHPLDKGSWDPEKAKTVLHDMPWDRIVLDEGHYIRNSKTKLHQMCSKLHSPMKWALTGTPIQNSEKDMAALLHFIGKEDPHLELENSIEEYMMRRTKRVLMEDNDTFTDYRIINHNCSFETKYEQDLYDSIERDAIAEFNSMEGANGFKTNMVLLEMILRLRQATVHPNIAVESIQKKLDAAGLEGFRWPRLEGVSTKIKAVINQIKQSSGLSLVFCHFKAEMELIQEYLMKEKIYSELYNGSMSPSEREEVIDKFKSNKPTIIRRRIGNRTIVTKKVPTVLLIQIKAGGVGLNLQEFSNVFIVSPDWNPSNEIQAISRSHRLGQLKKVNVHKFTLVSNPEFEKEMPEGEKCQMTTIDERILHTQKVKRDIMTDLLDDSTLEFNEQIVGRVPIRQNAKDLKTVLMGYSY
tara:strand:- start:409 stop:2067 length:1659 start_codon:yes stop_codon:yes gene_type:complete